MAQGTVKWFNAEKGFRLHQHRMVAALTCSSTTLRSRLTGYRSLDENQRVEFEVTQGQKGPQAENVRPL